MGRLTDRVAVITGGTRGIGATIARRLAEEGASVAICDILLDGAQETAREIERTGGHAFAVRLNVACRESWQQAREAIIARWQKIHILVNNAGVNDRGTIASTQVADWERTMSINLMGPFLGMQTFCHDLRDAGDGAIVNTASLAAQHGGPQAAYGASKWGLKGLTQIAAMEFVDWGIRVNCVSPAVVETELNAGQPYLRTMSEMTPMRRNGTALEVADAVVFLVSREASFITGQDIRVDGGFTAGAAQRYAEKFL